MDIQSLVSFLADNSNAINDLTSSGCGILPTWVWNLINNVMTIIKIAIPVLLIILGSVELGKAVVASDEKKVKEAQKGLVTKIGYGLAVFLLSTVIIWILGDWMGLGETDSVKCISGSRYGVTNSTPNNGTCPEGQTLIEGKCWKPGS